MPLDLSENLFTLKVIRTIFGFFRNKTKDSSPLLIIRKNAGDGLVNTSYAIKEAGAESGTDPLTSVEHIKTPNLSVKSLTDKKYQVQK